MQEISYDGYRFPPAFPASSPDQGIRSSRALRLAPVNPNCNGADSDNDGYCQNYEHGKHWRLQIAASEGFDCNS
jgi:hypothetical protein